MGLEVKRLPSWAGKRVPKGTDDRACDECGRTWGEVPAPSDFAPDERGYVQLTGRIGVSVIRTVLCPSCADDLVSTVESKLDALENIAYTRTELWERAEATAVRMVHLREEQERERLKAQLRLLPPPVVRVTPTPDAGKRGVQAQAPVPSHPRPPRQTPGAEEGGTVRADS